MFVFLESCKRMQFKYKMSEKKSANQFGSSTGFKMKFLVLLLATAALASATVFGGKYIDIRQDGTIYIKGEDGKQIYISKHYGPYGQKNIEIEVTGPNDFSKMFQFDYNNQVNYGSWGNHVLNTFNKNYQDQYDILDVIFREYLGYVDEYTYQQLLNKVHKAVLNGYFDGQVLYLLQALVEDTKWDELISGHYSYGQFGDVLNGMTQQNKYGLGFLGKLFKGRGVYGQDYNQYDATYYYNVLMKIFDRQVLKTVVAQQPMYHQQMYGQFSYEKLWDMVFTHQGIFDHQYLVEIINNPELRSWFVQHGYFDKVVLDQILYAYKIEGIYDQYLLQKLVNTEVLKYFFVKQGVSVYDILGQTSFGQYNGKTFYNKGYLYGQNKGISAYSFLEKVLSQPTLRNAMVQYGIFHENILNQILYNYNIHGVYDHLLLRQLINKQALYNFLVQYGVVDQTVLRQWVDNEYLGLNFLVKMNFFEQTPKVNYYNNLFGVYGKVPEYTGFMHGGNFFKNFLYGKQYGYNQGPYSYGKWYHQYPLAQQVY